MTFEEAFDEIKKAFRETEEGKEIFSQGENALLPYLRRWAEAKVMILTGDDVQKLIGHEIVGAMRRSIDDLSLALQSQLVDYAVDKLEQVLRRIITGYVIPAIIG